MEVKTAFFYLFSIVMLFAAFRVVTARNPVHAVLFLMLTFSQASGLWFLLKAEFLAITLVLVYLGAVMVLFLFVVMMLDINIDTLRQGFWRYFPLAFLIGAIISLEMGAVLFTGYGQATQAPEAVDKVMNTSGELVQFSNTKALGTLLYTKYLYPVEIAAVILLVAMIAAIALTLRERKETKRIDPSRQIRVRAADRFKMVKLAPTKGSEPTVAESPAAVEEVKK